MLIVLEIAAYLAGAALIAYLAYTLFLAPGSGRASQAKKSFRRLDRREQERGDRRRGRQPPPQGVERRKGPRRERDT